MSTKAIPQPVFLKDYKKHPFSVSQIDLIFEIEERRTVVTGKYNVKRLDPLGQDPLVLNGEKMKLLSLNWPHYQVDDEHLTLQGVGASLDLELSVEIHPEENTALEGLYASGKILCSQNEPEGFRKIMYSIDRPDNLAVFTTTIRASKALYPYLLSNGNKESATDLPLGRHEVVWHDPFPKPSYLFALVAGDFERLQDSFITRSGRKVALEIFVDPGQLDKSHFAMASLKKAMKWDEERFGLEYDLNIFMIVAVNAFNMGAMENKGLNIFNASAVLAHPRSTTDASFLRIEAIIAHEYFHNWTGNRVTCRDWFQLTLKEGLTVFRDQEFSSDHHSRGVYRIGEVEALRDSQFAEDAGPLSHPIQPQSFIEINNFYTSTVYEKGAEVIRMIHTFLGEENFQKGMKLYFERHDGQAVTTEDFVGAMEAASGFDLRDFRRWYTQKGTPVLDVSSSWNPSQKVWTLAVTQLSEPLFMPLVMAAYDRSGQEVLSPRVLTLGESHQSWQFEGLAEAPIPSLNRGFSAPVILRYAYTPQEHLYLLAHDSDFWSRYEAGQQYMIQEILGQYQSFRGSGARPLLSPQWREVFRELLKNTHLDQDYLAQLLGLPSLETLNQDLPFFDFEGMNEVVQNLKDQLAQALAPEMEKLWRAVGNESAQARNLRQTLMGYLSCLKTPQWEEILWNQLEEAKNMSDELGALGHLVHRGYKLCNEALDLFYQRWQHDELVLHNWFAVQASSSDSPQTLDRVLELEGHPRFLWTFPNRVRALVYQFVLKNPVHYHRADGRGYQYLAQKVEHLDSLNPQVASRLAKLGTRCAPRLDPDRKALLKKSLLPLLENPSLSRDVYEVVSKTVESL